MALRRWRSLRSRTTLYMVSRDVVLHEKRAIAAGTEAATSLISTVSVYINISVSA
jgi:hypothetical protein